MQDFFASLVQPLLGLLAVILATVVTASLAALRNWLNAKAGAAVADQLMTTLHRALDTGVNAALAVAPNATPADIVSMALTHAKASIPETIAALAPSAEVLKNIALAKLHWATPMAGVTALKP